jgi:outer membrane protein
VKNILVSLLIITAWCGSATLHAQSQKIGYVVSPKIFQELPEAQEAQRKIDAITKPLADSLQAMEKSLQAQVDEYQKKEAMMNESAKRAAQQDILELERIYNQFRIEKFGNDGELARQQEKIINPIRERIKKAIETVAREEKYSFVFDKTDQLQILLYGDANHDLTFKVLDKLRRGK